MSRLLWRHMRGLGLTGALAGALATCLPGTGAADEVDPIPAFARMFRTSCSTCHTAAPKLNVLGEVFRFNGYELPESELLIREDGPVPLGTEEWKDEWPRAVWPGEIPGQVPLALRIQTDARVARRDGDAERFEVRAPHEVYLLAGGPLGSGLGVFLEAEWSPEDDLEVVQAKMSLRNPIPGLSDGSSILWFGRLNPFLFTFTDPQIDRAGRVTFRWQDFRLSSVALDGGGGDRRSPLVDRLAEGRAGVELAGVAGDRFTWGFGLSQTAPVGGEDRAGGAYYKLRYKLGGMDLRGQYGPGGGPVPGSRGQLYDRSLTLEHFGSVESDAGDGAGGAQRAFGVAARTLQGPLDLGVGYVWRRFEDPWGADGRATTSSLFGKAELFLWPWVIGSLKIDHFDLRDADGAVPSGFALPAVDDTRVIPGVVLLVRQNLRAVFEGEFFTRGVRRNALWIRLDLSF